MQSAQEQQQVFPRKRIPLAVSALGATGSSQVPAWWWAPLSFLKEWFPQKKIIPSFPGCKCFPRHRNLYWI